MSNVVPFTGPTRLIRPEFALRRTQKLIERFNEAGGKKSSRRGLLRQTERLIEANPAALALVMECVA